MKVRTVEQVPIRPELRKWRILFVHSDAKTLHSIMRVLRKRGIKVLSLREVIKRVETREY